LPLAIAGDKRLSTKIDATVVDTFIFSG